jgi:GTP1/Obg family GTP-binding protein
MQVGKSSAVKMYTTAKAAEMKNFPVKAKEVMMIISRSRWKKKQMIKKTPPVLRKDEEQKHS